MGADRARGCAGRFASVGEQPTIALTGQREPVDRIEIDDVVMRAWAPDGRETRATARRALANGDGSEVQLFGSAQVVREAARPQDVLEFRSEFLHAFLSAERVRSHLPVWVRQGGAELRADGMEYDNLAHVVELKGRQRATFVPRARAAAP